MLELMEMIQSYIKPELIILIPVLNIVSSILTKSKIKTVKIPYILGVLSIALTGIYTLATAPSYNISNILMAIFTSITQGILLVGASTYIYIIAVKIPRQCKKCNNGSRPFDHDIY